MNYSHDYMDEKYFICYEANEKGYQECYLTPLKDELMQIINDNMPETYRKKVIDFPEDAVWRVNSGGGRGATRTFTDDAEQAAKKIIVEVNQILN